MTRHALPCIIGSALLLSCVATVRAQSIEDYRPTRGVPAPLTTTQGLHQAGLLLQSLVPGVAPLLDTSFDEDVSGEELTTAQTQVLEYQDALIDVLILAALLVNSEDESPVPLSPLIRFMNQEARFLGLLCDHVSLDLTALYQGLISDPRFEQIDGDIQVALIGRYIQQLLLQDVRSSAESAALSGVESDDFFAALGELGGTRPGVADLQDYDWASLVGKTVDISYLDMRMRLVSRTVSVTNYDFRYGLILPPLDEDSPNVHVAPSRVETLILSSP
jgi:hypothetical protein